MSPQTATNAKERQSYERALHFLKANIPEKRLDIHLSYESFRALEVQAQALYGDMRARVKYSAIDSRVTIHTAPTALHSSAAVSLQEGIAYEMYWFSMPDLIFIIEVGYSDSPDSS
ncbi:hypothetical protein V1520DRAFT_356226 [Lipomyces starkeyi]